VALTCAACAVLVFVASIAAVAFGIVLSSNERIQENLRVAVEDGTWTDVGASPYGHANLNYDTSTECLALGMNLSSEGRPLLWRMAATPTVTVPAVDSPVSCAVLMPGLQAHDVRADVPYPRYWHGYQFLTRPLMSVLPFGVFRRVISLILLGSVCFLALQLARMFGLWAWCSLLPFFLIGDLFTAQFLIAHSLPLAVGFVSIAGLGMLLERFDYKKPWILAAFVFSSGMLVNFIGFLINPPLAPTFMAFLVIARGTGEDWRRTLQHVAYAGALVVAWYAGYFVEWVAKWVFASAVLGPELGFGHVLHRFRDYNESGAQSALQFLDATKQNYWAAGGRSILGVFLVLVGAAVAAAVAMRRVAPSAFIDLAAMLAPLLGIIAWVEATPSISFIHADFVSRSFILFYTLPFLAAVLLWRRRAVSA
jgi:hypothetical protein